MFGDQNNRDLEGMLPPYRRNEDGSIGEYFTKSTKIESPYTDIGVLYIDWEHGVDVDADGNNPDNILGYVDWKTAKVDDKGIKVSRVLSRRNKYMKMLEEFLQKGLLATSSMPIQNAVKKSVNGEILEWPLLRDSLTVTPMEWRMVTDKNTLELVKSLRLELENDGLTNTELYKSLPQESNDEIDKLQLEIEVGLNLVSL